MVPVEAQACGTPVVARRIGGVLDSVVDGTTGRLYDGGEAELAAALRAFDPAAFDAATVRRHAEGFGHAPFREALGALVDRAVDSDPTDRHGS